MDRIVRMLLLGTSLAATLGASGCLVERHHHRHDDYYGRHEYRCYGDDCYERRHW